MYGYNYAKAAEHFMRNGYNEGRWASPEHEASGLPFHRFVAEFKC